MGISTSFTVIKVPNAACAAGANCGGSTIDVRAYPNAGETCSFDVGGRKIPLEPLDSFTAGARSAQVKSGEPNPTSSNATYVSFEAFDALAEQIKANTVKITCDRE